MNVTSVSIKSFVMLFPEFAKTVNHFLNRKNVEVISGKAELLTDSIVVSYTHDLSTGLFTVRHHGIPLHQQIAFTCREVLAAFKTAEDTFFMADSFTVSYEDVSLLETDKGKRIEQYRTSKKAIKDNHRGQHGRWNDHKAMRPEREENERKVMKAYMKSIGASHSAGKHISLTDTVEIACSEEYYEFPSKTSNVRRPEGKSGYTYLCEGMNLLVYSDGTVGALSFNPNYQGCRIIRAA